MYAPVTAPGPPVAVMVASSVNEPPAVTAWKYHGWVADPPVVSPLTSIRTIWEPAGSSMGAAT
ncbi:MAG: hypothetical protein R2726_07515 [Acidimicrobiales bacterium]